jgi:hypothetical protein
MVVNSFQAIAPYMGQEKGSFFMGVYLPQKSVLSPPIERQYTPFQKHVSSYQVKISKSCFVWAAPTLLRGGPYLKNEENSLNIRERCRNSNPASVKAREEVRKVWHAGNI